MGSVEPAAVLLRAVGLSGSTGLGACWGWVRVGLLEEVASPVRSDLRCIESVGKAGAPPCSFGSGSSAS